MAILDYFEEIWQGSQNRQATQNESPAQNMQIAAIWYISDPEESVKTSWSLSEHDGAAAFKWSEWLQLPPALSAKGLAGGQTQVLTIGQIQRITHHPAESDDNSAPGTIAQTENWLIRNGDVGNPYESENNCEADNESNA